jgi:hypothetical protein
VKSIVDLYTSFTPLPPRYPHLLLTSTWPQPLRVCSSASANIMPSERDELKTAAPWVSGECVDLTDADCQTREVVQRGLVDCRTRTQTPRSRVHLDFDRSYIQVYTHPAWTDSADSPDPDTRLVALGQHGLCRSSHPHPHSAEQVYIRGCMRGRC